MFLAEKYNRKYKLNKKDKEKFKFEGYLYRGICYRKMLIVQEEGEDLQRIKEQKNENLDKSIDDLKQACELNNKSAEAQNNLGLSYFEKKWYPEAALCFQNTFVLDKDNPNYMNNYALARYHKGIVEKNIDDFKHALSAFQGNIKFDLKNLYKIYFNCGNVCHSKAQLSKLDLNQAFKDAHDYYQQSFNEFEGKTGCEFPKKFQAKIMHSQGLVYETENQPGKALEAFQKALELNTNHLPSKYHIALINKSKNEYEEVIKYYTEILIETEGDRLVYEKRGLLYQELKQHKLAIEDFDQAIKIQANFPMVYYHRGRSKIGIDLLNEAISDFKLAMNYSEIQHPNFFHGLSQSYRKLKEYKKAEYYLEKALEMDDKNPRYLLERAVLYADQKNYKKSIKCAVKAEKQDPDNPMIFYIRGTSNYHSYHYKSCIRDLISAVKKNIPETYKASIYYHIGISFANIEMYDRAICPLGKAIEFCQTDIRYYHERAKCNLFVQKYEAALQDFNVVIEAQPQNKFAYFGRGFAYKNLKDTDKDWTKEAANDWEKAKELDPTDPRLVMNYRHVWNVNYIQLVKAGQEQKDIVQRE